MRPGVSRVVLAAALVLLPGCSEPSGPVLEGQWGGEALEVVANRQGAEIRPACGVARLRDPLVLNSDGEVDVRAVVDGGLYFQRIRFQASLDGDRLAARVTWFHPDGSRTVGSVDLLRGQAPNRAGIICPA